MDEVSGGDLLRQSAEAIEGDREQTHGSKEACFGAMAAYLEVFLRHRNPNDLELRSWETALIMILWKIARIQAGQAAFADHYRDIAGYAGCAWECIRKK